MNNYGFTPRKSLTLTFPDENIFKSKDLIRHFIRGNYDGDGCLSWANKDHSKPIVSILGTEMFLNSMQKYSSLNYFYKLGCKNKNPNTRIFAIIGKSAICFMNFIYNNSRVYLNRKFDLYNNLKYCRLSEESDKLLSTNIGEPCDGNTEIND